MATIHPKPKRLTMRADGDGGLDVFLVNHRGEPECWPISRGDAALFLGQLAEYVGRKFRAADEVDADLAVEKLRHHMRGAPE